MASMEVLLASPIEWSVRATGVNATVTASKAAPSQGVGFRHYIFGWSFSCSAAVAATTEMRVRSSSGATILDAVQLIAGNIPPQIINYGTHPLEGDDNADVDLNVPALGAGVICVAVLKGTTRCRG